MERNGPGIDEGGEDSTSIHSAARDETIATFGGTRPGPASERGGMEARAGTDDRTGSGKQN
jgi:hypothetical protein